MRGGRDYIHIERNEGHHVLQSHRERGGEYGARAVCAGGACAVRLVSVGGGAGAGVMSDVSMSVKHQIQVAMDVPA